MGKLKISKECATSLIGYLSELQEIERWHENNGRRQGAWDIESQYAGRVRLITFLINEALINLDLDEDTT